MANTLKPLTSYESETSKIAFTWLLKLRWGAVISQLLLIAIVSLFFDISIPYPVLLLVIFFQICSNLYFHFLEKRNATISPSLFGMVMAWDIVHLTLLIYFTGGPMNPFTFLYLVHVVIGSILMRQKWAWGLASLTIIFYALLFLLPPAPDFEQGLVATPAVPVCLTNSSLGLHLQGMWLGYSITAIFIVFFVSKIRAAMESHQQTLAKLDEEKRRSEKMASLATLAAGAAHEFSTPLSTITIAAGEMSHHLQEHDGDPELISDANLIKSEINKCRNILQQLAADSGQHLGESIVAVSLAKIIDIVSTELEEETGQPVTLDLKTGNHTLNIPLQSFIRTIKGLYRNAHDACPDGEIYGRIYIDEDNYLCFSVTDEGSGMSEETASRASEPFYTTKDPGNGLGLGLFLSRSLAERFGGDLLIESVPSKGATVIFRVDCARIIPNEEAINNEDHPAC
jgi:two-component system sensor histidine kinase RegB